jgi:hypothetical protein
LGFLKLQLSTAYLGADRPRGLRGVAWAAGMALAILVVTVFVSLYAVDRVPDFLRQLGLLQVAS